MARDDLLPPEDIHLQMAYTLMARSSDLDLRVLHALLGRPKRYGELRPLLGERRDHNLTMALERLQRDGLADRMTDARREPVVHTYELTPLGIEVVLTAHALRVLHESAALHQRARTAAKA